ncbi:MAG: hypothetical protein R2778_10145 [Saprospiraceae bacterium]
MSTPRPTVRIQPGRRRRNGPPDHSIGTFSVAAVMVYKAFLIWQLFSSPKEVKLAYVPSDFQPNLDEESTLRFCLAGGLCKGV